jgi:5-methylcytosine-specific restriction endonuclease McrA
VLTLSGKGLQPWPVPRRPAADLSFVRGILEADQMCPSCGAPIVGRRRRYCSKPCQQRVAYRKWRLQNLARARAGAAEWARKNPERRRALTLRSAHERRVKNPARERALALADRQKHRARVRRTLRAWYVKNRERVNAAARETYRRQREAGHERAKGTHTARARRFGAPRDYSIKPLLVFARDGWRCQLCGCATPQSLRGSTHPHAPELDHIVPLSVRGGPGHVWTNVQCACRRCNSQKGARPLGQLRLE